MHRGEAKKRINQIILSIYDILEIEEEKGDFSFSENSYEFLLEYEKMLSFKFYIKRYLSENELLDKYSNLLQINDSRTLFCVYQCLKDITDEKEQAKAIFALTNLDKRNNEEFYENSLDILKYYSCKEDCVFKDVLDDVEMYDTDFMKEEFISSLIDEYTTKNISKEYSESFKNICSDLLSIPSEFFNVKGREQFIELLNK